MVVVLSIFSSAEGIKGSTNYAPYSDAIRTVIRDSRNLITDNCILS